jgi:acid phosphatase class B
MKKVFTTLATVAITTIAANSAAAQSRSPDGIPTEGCAFGPIEKDADGTAIVKLTCFN